MNNPEHYLYKKQTIKRLSIIGLIVLVLVVFAELFINLHGYFESVNFFAFNAIYGFVSCVLMVLFAKLLGYLIKRHEGYYDK